MEIHSMVPILTWVSLTKALLSIKLKPKKKRKKMLMKKKRKMDNKTHKCMEQKRKKMSK
jgi:hypothetical protein